MSRFLSPHTSTPPLDRDAGSLSPDRWPPGSLPEAVLLDMDGLLVDTEPVWFEVERDVARRLGGRTWTEEHQHALLGSSLPRAAAYLLDVTGGDAAGETVEQWLLEGMADRLSARAPAVRPGAVELLRELGDAGLPCALVSSSYRLLVDPVVAGLRDVVGTLPFGVTVAGDEVTHRKPHPDPYVRAARALGAEPARCVVLEDSLPGVESGHAAGCAVVAVPSLVPVPDAPGRHVASSLHEVDLALLARVTAAARLPDSR